MSRNKNQWLLLAVVLAVSACSAIQRPSNVDLLRVTEQQKAQLNEPGRIMYSYLLGQVAGVHSTLAEQDRSPEKVSEYLNVAVPNLVEASASIDDVELAEHATKAATYSRHYDLALRAAQRWVELQPNESRAHQYAALSALRQGDQEQALTHFSYVVELAANVDDGLLDVGALLSREADADAVLPVAEQLVELYPDTATALYVQASVLLRFEKQELCLEKLEQALHKKPSYRSAKLLKANVLQRLGRKQEALALLQAEVEAHPDDLELRSAYARSLIAERRYADARDQYEALFKANPNNIDLAFRLGMLTLELQQLDLADKYFMHVLRSGKRTFETLYHLGRLAELRKEHKTALQYYMRVTEGEYRLESRLREAKMLALLGQVSEGLEAIDALQAANSDDSLDVRFYLAKMDVHVQLEDYSAALAVANQALAAHQEDFDLLFTRSMLLEKLGDVPGAIADLEILLAQRPENADILNALGYTLANRTEQYARAKELLDKAIALKPDSAAIADSMGWVLYKQGQLTQAEKYIRKAYTQDPDPEIAAHLGEVLWVQGMQREADEIWQKALETNPDHEVLNAVIQQYKK